MLKNNFAQNMFLSLILTTTTAVLGTEQQRMVEGTRFLGRGNTFVAAFDSDDATKGNPATLAEPVKLNFQLRPVEYDLFIGENSLDTLNDITKIDFNNDGLMGVLQTFSDKFGKRQYLRNQFMPLSMRISWFEISPFVTNSNYIDMRVPAIPEVVIKSDTIMGTNLAFSVPLQAKKLYVGLNLKPFYRYYIGGEMAFSDVMEFMPPSTKEISTILPQKSGMGLGTDIGINWLPSDTFRLGLLVENAGYAGSLGSGDDSPPPIPMRVSLGAAKRAQFGKRWVWDFYADLADVINPEKYQFIRLLHLGTELGTSYFTRDLDVGLQTGINEGYFTFGGFCDLYLVRLEFINYAVELGEYPGQRMDRRYGISLKTSMTF